MVGFTIQDARRAGFDAFILHAQAHLKEFYRAFDFEQVGDEFVEAGIPHFKMIRVDRQVSTEHSPDQH
jgi:predicted GNAT family N-acyltransferase